MDRLIRSLEILRTSTDRRIIDAAFATLTDGVHDFLRSVAGGEDDYQELLLALHQSIKTTTGDLAEALQSAVKVYAENRQPLSLSSMSLDALANLDLKTFGGMMTTDDAKTHTTLRSEWTEEPPQQTKYKSRVKIPTIDSIVAQYPSFVRRLDAVEKQRAAIAEQRKRMAERLERQLERLKLVKHRQIEWRGATPDRRTGRWRADMMVNGRPHYIGMFTTREEALAARQQAEANAYASVKELKVKRLEQQKTRGVSFDKSKERWKAKCYHQKVLYFLGYFSTQSEALAVIAEARQHPERFTHRIAKSRNQSERSESEPPPPPSSCTQLEPLKP